MGRKQISQPKAAATSSLLYLSDPAGKKDHRASFKKYFLNLSRQNLL
jgi:hypothetical protein